MSLSAEQLLQLKPQLESALCDAGVSLYGSSCYVGKIPGQKLVIKAPREVDQIPDFQNRIKALKLVSGHLAPKFLGALDMVTIPSGEKRPAVIMSFESGTTLTPAEPRFIDKWLPEMYGLLETYLERYNIYLKDNVLTNFLKQGNKVIRVDFGDTEIYTRSSGDKQKWKTTKLEALREEKEVVTKIYSCVSS